MHGTEDASALESTLVRLASTPDEDLERVLGRILPKLLGFLDRPSSATRTALLRILKHVNQRLSALPNVQLPTAPLAVQYLHESMSPERASFILVYIEKGMKQMEPSHRSSILESILQHIHTRPRAQQRILLHMFLLCLPQLTLLVEEILVLPAAQHKTGMAIPYDRSPFSFLASEKDRMFLLSFLQTMLLMTLPPREFAGSPESFVPPGLSSQDKEMCFKRSMVVEDLTRSKEEITSFLKSGAFRGEEVFLPLIVASVCSSDHVRAAAKTAMKRISMPQLDSCPALCHRVMELYTGSPPSIAAEKRKTPAPLPLKHALLVELCKSVKAAQHSSLAFKILLDALFGSYTFPKLRQCGYQYLQWLLLHGNKSFLKKLAPTVISKLLPRLHSEDANRALLYSPVAQLSLLCPQHVNKSIQLAKFYFDSLYNQPVPVQNAAAEGLGHLLQVYSDTHDTTKQELKTYLMAVVTPDTLLPGSTEYEPTPRRHELALRWLCSLFPFSDVQTRFVCCIHAAFGQERVRKAAEVGLQSLVFKDTLEAYPPLEDMLRFLLTALQSCLYADPKLHQQVAEFTRKCWFYDVHVRKTDISHECLDSFVGLLLQSFDQSAFRGQSILSFHISSLRILTSLTQEHDHVRLHLWNTLGQDRMLASLQSHHQPVRESMSYIIQSCCKGSARSRDHVMQLLHRVVVTLGSTFDIDALHGHLLVLGKLLRLSSEYAFEESFLQQTTGILVRHCGNKSSLLASAAADSLAHVASMQGLVLDPNQFSVKDTIGRLLKLVRGTSEDRCSEKAVLCLKAIVQGWNRTSVTSEAALRRILATGLLELHTTRDEVIISLSGAALTELCREASLREFILGRILNELAPDASALSRKSFGVWMLDIINSTFQHNVSSFVMRVHDYYLGLLMEPKVPMQEIGCKGLYALYHRRQEHEGAALVKALYRFLDQKPGSIHQQLCAVLYDFGKPQWSYFFLGQLCKDAFWSSSEGSKFNYGSFDEASAALLQSKSQSNQEHVLQLLFLYRFHPKAAIQDVMRQVWQACQANEGLFASIESMQGQILVQCIHFLGQKRPLLREMSCAAMAEIVRFDVDWHVYMNDLLIAFFYVLDDMDESVRQSAFSMSKSLKLLFERICVTTNPSAPQLVDCILPILLDKGIAHKSKEIQQMSIESILVLIRVGGVLIKPHVVRLIDVLLQCLSSLEPAELSYAMFHTASLDVSREQLESMRIMLANTSPISQAIDQCIGLLDSHLIHSMMERLCEVIRTGVGLATLHKTANAVQTLLSQFKDASIPIKRLIRVCRTKLSDQSATIRLDFVTCLAKLCVLSVDGEQDDIYSTAFQQSQSDDDTARQVAAHLAIQICKGSVHREYERYIPLVLIGMHDHVSDVAHVWPQFWEYCPIAKSSAIASRWSAILGHMEYCLSLQQYHLRTSAAKAVVSICRSNTSDVKAHANSIAKVLAVQCDGRYWHGKEAVLAALQTVLELEAVRLPNDFWLRLVQEAKLDNRAYRSQAITMIGSVYSMLSHSNHTHLHAVLVQAVEEDDIQLLQSAFGALASLWLKCDTSFRTASDQWAVSLLGRGIAGQHSSVRIAALDTFAAIQQAAPLHQSKVESLLEQAQDATKDKNGKIRAAALGALYASLKHAGVLSDSWVKTIHSISTTCLNDTNSSASHIARQIRSHLKQ